MPITQSNLVFQFNANDLNGDGNVDSGASNGDAVTTWVDSSSASISASTTGGTLTRTISGNDYGVNFAGSAGKISVPNATAINTFTTSSERSFSFVFKTGSSVAGTQIIYEQGGGTRGYQLAIANDGSGPKILAYVWNKAEWGAGHQHKVLDLGTAAADTVYSVAFVHDATGATLADRTFTGYVDGQQVAQLTNVDVQRAHSGGVVLGGTDNTLDPVTFASVNSGSGFEGVLYSAISWNGALAQTDVAETHQQLIEDVEALVGNAPVFTSAATASITEGQTSVLDVDANNGDGGTTDSGVTYSLSGGADQALFSINSSTGAVSFSSAPNFEAPGDANTDNVYEVEVTANDGSLTATQTLSITVTDVAEAPEFTSSTSASVLENQSAAIDVNANNGDGGANDTGISYTLSGGADQALFDIDGSTGVVTFKATPDFEAPGDAGADNVYNIEVSAYDGTLTSTQAIAITVTNIANETSPTITSSTTASVDENQTVAIDVDAHDGDGGASDAGITYTLSGGADQALFSINSSTGEVSFANAPNFEAPVDADTNNVYEIQVTADDGGFTTNQTISITVGDVAEVPVFETSAAVSVQENETTAIDINANNGEGGATDDGVTFGLTGGADIAQFNINNSTGELTFKNAPDFEAPSDANSDNVFEVQVTANDGALTTTQTLNVTVTNIVSEQPPAFESGTTASADENQLVAADINANDGDGGATDTNITYSLTGGADQALFSINASTGVVSFLAAPDYETPGDANSDGVYEITVRADDGVSNVEQTVSITVSDVAEAPVFTSAVTATVDENQTSAIDVNANNGEGGADDSGITYSLTGGADQALFQIDSATGAVTFAANPDFESPSDSGADNVYNIEVTANDGVLSSVQSIAITVADRASELPPEITSAATATVDENQTGAIDVQANDGDGGASDANITYSLTGGADQALFQIDSATGIVSFAAAPSYESPGDANANNVYEIEVTADDGTGTVSQAIQITVQDVANEEVPVFTSSSSATVAENQTSAIDVNANDGDGGSTDAGITYTLTGGADQALFNIDTNSGVLTFKSAPTVASPSDSDTNSIYEVEVTANDGARTSSQTINLTVTDGPISTNLIENTGSSNLVTVNRQAAVTLETGGAGVSQVESVALQTFQNALLTRNTSAQKDLLARAADFFRTLDDGASVDTAWAFARTTGNTPPDAIQFDGNSSNTTTDALLVDTRLTPIGTEVSFDDVSFATILGRAKVTTGASDTFLSSDELAQEFALGAGNDTVYAGAGNDTFSASAGRDVFWGEDGNDSISGGADDDSLMGGFGADEVFGGDGADIIYGNQSNDAAYGGAGADVLYGGQNDDRIFGDAGNDTLFGNLGSDAVYGGTGDDLIHGDDGDDILSGGAGSDTLYGGGGADRFHGGSGQNIIHLDAGEDILIVSGAVGTDVVYGFDVGGTDRIGYSGELSYSIRGASGDQGIETTLTFSNGHEVRLIGVSSESFSASDMAVI